MPRYTFDPFSLDTEARTLLRDGEPVPMAGKTFDTLVVLVQNRGRLVDKDELLSRVWPGTVVEEANLSQAIFTVRKILGDSPKDPRYIATIAGRGYQFIAPVTELLSETPLMAEGVHEAPIKRYKKLGIGISAAVAALVTLAWFALPRPPKPPAEMTQKRLTFNSSENPVQSAAISPDGKYLAYSDSAGIHVKLLSTSEERLIPKPSEVPMNAFWSVDSWFPDSAQLLADAFELGGHHSIWAFSILGAQPPRQIRQRAAGFEVSPDGKRIAFSPLGAPYLHWQVWVMGSQGDNPRKVVQIGENEWISSVHWSPDGQRLAYVKTERTSDSFRNWIETCDLNGANRMTVVPDAGVSLSDFWWLPEGRMVYARQDSHGSSDNNLWQIGIDNHRGTPAGKPGRITSSAGSGNLGLAASADGKQLALLKSTNQTQVYLGELAAGGTRIKLPRRLMNGEAEDSPTAWTADSKTVLFGSNRNGTYGIFKQGISQETADPIYVGPEDVSDPRVTADGGSILFLVVPRATVNPGRSYRMMRVPLSGGPPEFVLETQMTVDQWCAHAPASLCAIFEMSKDLKQLKITAFDPIKGRGKALRIIANNPVHSYGHVALSPDGSTFAISRVSQPEIRIRLLSTSGDSDREITVKGWPNITGLDWSPDGKGLFCGSQSPQGGTLLYVDLKGDVRVLWQSKSMHGGIWGVPSPDGRYIVIGGEVTNSNVWMLEGF